MHRRSSFAASIADTAARCLAMAALAAVLLYPVSAFLRLRALPLGLRAAWLLVPIAAWRWPWWSLLAFVVVAPLVPTLPSWFEWPPIAPAEILFFGILLPALIRTVLGKRPWQPRAQRLAVLVGAVATASVVVVVYPLHLATDGVGPLLLQIHEFGRTDFIVAQSQQHLFGSLTAWAMLLEGLALMWLVLSEPVTASVERAMAQLVTAAGIGAILVAALGVSQWWTGRGLLTFWLQQNPNITRINSTFTDVNGLGSYLAMMVPIALGLAMRHDGPWRWSWRAGGALLMVAVLFTASRSAWVALAIGLALHGAAIWRFRVLPADTWIARHAWHVIAGATAAIVLIVGVLSAYATARDVRFYDEDSYFETLLYTVNLRAPAQERLKGRLAFWAAATSMIAERPVFGIGVGRFYKEVAVYAPDPAALPRRQENAHNYFLQIAAELGLVGFAAWAAVLVAAGLPSLRVAASEDHAPGARHLALAVPIGLVVYLLTWSTGHPLLVREGQFAFWPLVGAASALGATAHLTSRARPVSGWMLWAVIGLVAASVPFRAARDEARVDLTRLSSGLHEPEIDPSGHQFQWTVERAVFYVPSNAQILEFNLRSLAPFEQTVTVVLDGSVADRLKLGDHAWHPERYPLPHRQAASRYRRVELVVSPVWQPSTDPRTLGVQLKDLGWVQ
jgi:O-antigen ligase